MGKVVGGAGPDQTTSASVAFLVGSRAWSDGFLVQGEKWAKAIQKAAGGAPEVQVEQLSSQLGSVRQTIDKVSKLSAGAQLSTSVLDQNFGGLRGHTLIFVTHGLTPHDPTASQSDQEKTQGILIHNQAKGDSPLDVNLFKMHLDFMTTRERGTGLPEDAEVIPDPSLANVNPDPDSLRFKKQVEELAPVVDALRRSVYSRIYLASCGGGRRLEKFAHKLAVLTLKVVYFNHETISFPTPPTAPEAEVGPVVNNATNIVDGTRFFKSASSSADQVKLKSATDTFLPGAQEWVAN